MNLMNLTEIAESISESANNNLRGLLRYAPDDESKLTELERVSRDIATLDRAIASLRSKLTEKIHEERDWLRIKKQSGGTK
jgi:hypothetical protein